MKKYAVNDQLRADHSRGKGARTAVTPLTWLIAAAGILLVVVPSGVLARVGGGGSYGGGGGHGGGGGGGGAIVAIVRLLLWLTIEYPAVGIPLDIIVIGFVVYRLVRGGPKSSETFPSPSGQSPHGAA